MIVCVLQWGYIISLVGACGLGAFRLLARLFRNAPGEGTSIVLVWLLGLTTLTTLASFLSIIFPLGWFVHLILLAIGLAIVLLERHRLRNAVKALAARLHTWHWLVWVIGALAFLILLEVSTRLPSNADSGQYHVQAIRWLETYRAVPGLGNLLTRFAFNSSWLVVNAFFTFSFLGGQSYHLLPGALCLVMIFQSLSGIDGLLRNRITPSNCFNALLLPFFFALLTAEVSSPGTDLPVILITWLAIGVWMGMIEEQKRLAPAAPCLLWLVCVFCVTIKLSAAVLPLGGLAILFVRRRDVILKRLVAALLLAVIVLAPWLVRNVILSGYLIYPFPYIDLFTFDWKIPRLNAISDLQAIRDWARAPRTDPLQFGTAPLDWLGNWWGNQTWFRRSLLILLGVLPVLQVALACSTQARLRQVPGYYRRYAWVILCAYAGVAFWLLTAPDFRFGISFIVPAFLLVGIGVLHNLCLLSVKVTRITGGCICAALALFLAVTLVCGVEPRTLSHRWLDPEPYPELPSEPCRLHNVSVFTPAPAAWSNCWYSSFPCTPHCEAGVETRGESWQDGFRWPVIYQ